MDTQAYQNGLNALKNKDYKAAERDFKRALEADGEMSSAANDVMSIKAQSYYGLAQVLNANENGLLLCRDAASRETADGDVFMNLACAELERNNRKRAIEAIQHGVTVDPHNDRLKRACAMADCRRRCCFGFISREHWLNRFFGRLRRRDRPGVLLTVDSLLY